MVTCYEQFNITIIFTIYNEITIDITHKTINHTTVPSVPTTESMTTSTIVFSVDESISRSIAFIILGSSPNKPAVFSECVSIFSIGLGDELKNLCVSLNNSGVCSFHLPGICPTIPIGSVNFSIASTAS